MSADLTTLVTDRLLTLQSKQTRPLSDLSDTEFQQVETFYLLNKYAAELRKQLKRQGITFEDCFCGWLERTDRAKTVRTQQLYAERLHIFVQYLSEYSLHFLDVKAKQVDEFIAWLRQQDKYAPKTMRSIISVSSSFYSYLERHQHIRRNFFRGAAKPKDTHQKTASEVPTSPDIELMRLTLLGDMQSGGRGGYKRREQAMVLYPVLHVLCEYLIRVDAVPTLTIDRNGYATVFSKNHEYGFVLYPNTTPILNQYCLNQKEPFACIKPTRIQKAIERLVRRLPFAEKYSVHDLRHYGAVKLYLQTKDIKRVQLALGHQHLDTTDKYLASLNVQTIVPNPAEWFDVAW